MQQDIRWRAIVVWWLAQNVGKVRIIEELVALKPFLIRINIEVYAALAI